LEGDDYWTCEDKLQRQVEFLNSHPGCAISCHRARFINEMTPGDTTIFPSISAGTYSIDDLLRGNFIMTCSAVCRWGLLGKLPDWFLGLKLADWPMFALLARDGTIQLMDEVMADYRVHSGGVWSSRSESSRLAEGIRALHFLGPELGERHVDSVRKAIAHLYLRRAEIARAAGNRAETAMCLVNCLRYGGAHLDGGPTLRGFAWYALLGTWHPALAKAKRAILG